MCFDKRLECGRLSKLELDDALFDAAVTDELVDFHMERERRAVSSKCGNATSIPLNAGLRDVGVRFVFTLCQSVKLLPAAGLQAATLFDIICLRLNGGVLVEHLPFVCTVIVKLLKKTDSSTTSVPYASMVPHTQRMVEYVRQLGHDVPDATEEALMTQEAELLVALKWETDPFTIETWVSVFASRFNIITGGIHAAKLSKAWEQGLLCAQSLVARLPASPEMPPVALARGLLGVSFVCVGLLPMGPTACDGASPVLGALLAAVRASPAELQAACAVAAPALRLSGLAPSEQGPAAPAAVKPLVKSATLAPPLGKAATLAPSGKAPVMAKPAAAALGGKGALTPAKATLAPALGGKAVSPLGGKGTVAPKRNPNIPIRRIVYIDDLEMPKRPDLPPRDTDREVFLSRLPKDCTDEQLQDLIGGFGEIEDLHLIRDSFTSEFTGKGYVRFKTHKEALGCIQAHSDPHDKAEDDVIAKWSESERAQQKLRSVAVADCTDMLPAFCTAPGRLMPSLCQHASVKEAFVTAEWLPKVGMMAMIAKTGSPKQLHFTAVVTAPGEETLRGVLSTALELFHEQVHTHLETPEAQEILRKRAAGEEEAEEEPACGPLIFLVAACGKR
ncbi:unnamed protein product [Prorocentrum cordatum]|uniref:RRM domain-containing protein n=1 Tax=Prorocentrum cordatum TaxID=2364126 RepID=A0ABN9TJD5_9DINO|nr:unnamed protein product [Polarella glacialis]